ncbi:MAG: cobalt transporter CbiM, partial [bacterium]
FHGKGNQMHIAEGILKPEVWGAGMLVTAAIAVPTIRKMSNEDIPKLSVMTSVFFVASLISFPVPPTSVHLILNGLVGVILGWSAFPSILVALVMQAFLFGHGGPTSLGVNGVILGTPALVSFAIFKYGSRWNFNNSDLIVGFLAGASATILSGILLSLVLLTTGKGFLVLAQAALLAHLPIMIIEGAITGFVVRFLKRVKPELLPRIEE